MDDTELRVALLKNAKSFLRDNGLTRFVPKEIFMPWVKESMLKCYYLVRKSDNMMLGFALLHRYNGGPLRHVTNAYVIDYFYTFPEHTRKGVASTLLTKIRNHESTYFILSDSLPAHVGQIFRRAGHIEGVTPTGTRIMFNERNS